MVTAMAIIGSIWHQYLERPPNIMYLNATCGRIDFRHRYGDGGGDGDGDGDGDGHCINLHLPVNRCARHVFPIEARPNKMTLKGFEDKSLCPSNASIMPSTQRVSLKVSTPISVSRKCTSTPFSLSCTLLLPSSSRSMLSNMYAVLLYMTVYVCVCVYAYVYVCMCVCICAV